MSGNVSRRFLEKLQNKVKHKVDESELKALAGQMKKEDFSDEEKLRRLLKTLSGLSNTPLSSEKEEKIIQLFREKQINPNDVQSLSKLLK